MWGEDRRADDEVTDMALVGKRDGRNFGYGRQLILKLFSPSKALGMQRTGGAPLSAQGPRQRSS